MCLFTVDSTSIPKDLKQAVYVLAKAALLGVLIGTEERAGELKSETVEVGGAIKESKVYMDQAPKRKRFPEVDRLLRGLYLSRAGSINGRRVRA